MDWDKYGEIKEGEKDATKISEINEGTQADFRPESYFENFEDKKKVKEARAQPAIQVLCENGAQTVFTLPANGGKIHPKSNLALFKKTYGGFPEVGMEVTTKVDENGFQRVVLEK